MCHTDSSPDEAGHKPHCQNAQYDHHGVKGFLLGAVRPLSGRLPWARTDQNTQSREITEQRDQQRNNHQEEIHNEARFTVYIQAHPQKAKQPDEADADVPDPGSPFIPEAPVGERLNHSQVMICTS